jgi:hypothetical protein
MEPLKPLSDKLLILRQVDQVRCDKKGINAHFDGATGSFTAMPADGGAKAGGPSIDQIIRHDLYPQGLPAGMVPSLVAGTYFRRSRVGRYVHSYGLDGTVSATMQETPRQLFDRVFGSIPGNEDPDARRERLKRSVLDSVLDEYKHYSGPNSPLGATSKGRISDHFDRIREYEQRAFGVQQGGKGGPLMPARSLLPHGGKADPGGEGIDITGLVSGPLPFWPQVSVSDSRGPTGTVVAKSSTSTMPDNTGHPDPRDAVTSGGTSSTRRKTTSNCEPTPT